MSKSTHKLAILGSRLVLTGYCVMHGLAKFGAFSGANIGDFAQHLEGLGVAAPGLAAYALAGGLLLSGLALAVGAFHKVACSFIVLYLVGSICYVTGGNYFGVQGFEYAAALIGLASLFFLYGPGPLAYVVQFQKQQGDSRGR